MSPMLLTGGVLLDPAPQGRRDVLSVGGVVAAILEPGGADAILSALSDTETIDVSGLTLVPGLVDGHLHVLGGGGGSGPGSRIPELPADAILEAGITTCVGMPGVDTLTRPPSSLLAKSRGLGEHGVRCLTMAGGFAWPPPTATRSLRDELYLLPEVIGVKIALDEHLATAPSPGELARLLTELQWLRATTGKACVLHVHLGTRRSRSRTLPEALDAAGGEDIVQVTHANYSTGTLEEAGELGLRGCAVDVNPLLNPGRVAGSIDPVDAIAALIRRGVPVERLTLSSDGNASVPRILPDGSREPFSFQLSLLGTAREVVRRGVLDAEGALALITRTPASILRRDDVGRLVPGRAADIVAMDDHFAVHHVWSAGRLVVRDGRATTPSPFRDPRWSA